MSKKRTGGPVMYLVCRSGPEWTDPIELWPSKIQAENAAARYELDKSTTDIFEQLSTYIAVLVPIKGC
jgi:hypothetical protein